MHRRIPAADCYSECATRPNPDAGVHFRGHPAPAPLAVRFTGSEHEPKKKDQRLGWRIAMNSRLLACLLVLVLPVRALAQDVLQVQEIRCAGNQHVSCDFIRGHLHLSTGAALDEDEIRNAELRLSALRYFGTVAIHLEKGAHRGAVIVVIDVTENSPLVMETVAGGSLRLDVGHILVGSRIA